MSAPAGRAREDPLRGDRPQPLREHPAQRPPSRTSASQASTAGGDGSRSKAARRAGSSARPRRDVRRLRRPASTASSSTRAAGSRSSAASPGNAIEVHAPPLVGRRSAGVKYRGCWIRGHAGARCSRLSRVDARDARRTDRRSGRAVDRHCRCVPGRRRRGRPSDGRGPGVVRTALCRPRHRGRREHADAREGRGPDARTDCGWPRRVARLRFGRWIARPSATRPASLIASESVGCGAMPSATVSTVDSASIATTPASIRSVACGPTITSAEQLAVAGLVDRLDPADGLVLHHRARVRDPREPADRDVVAVLLARLRLGQPDAGDLGIGVDRPRHGADRRSTASWPQAFSAATSPSRNAVCASCQ